MQYYVIIAGRLKGSIVKFWKKIDLASAILVKVLPEGKGYKVPKAWLKEASENDPRIKEIKWKIKNIKIGNACSRKIHMDIMKSAEWPIEVVKACARQIADEVDKEIMEKYIQ